MNKFSPQISVEITLLPEELEGRAAPILQGEYRGIFTVREASFSVRFCMPSEGMAINNSVHNFDIQFLLPESASPYFPEGAIFEVWDGRNIGNGRVLKVFKNS